MDTERVKQVAKVVVKNLATAMILVISVTIVSHVLTVTYDHRIFMGVFAGYLGFKPVLGLLDKIKALQ